MARILVVEDDPSFLDLLLIHLSRAGHSVHSAGDPAIGLRSVIDDPLDLIVSDLNLPYLHGFEFLEALRSDPVARRIPVIVLSGRKDEESYARCLEIGITDYFSKPVNSEVLIEAITRRLAEAGAELRVAAEPGP